MARLGFLGLGIMGAPMARRPIEAGHDVALWSPNTAKAKQLAASAGGFAWATAAEVAHHSESVFPCVGDTRMSREVILGASGLTDGASPDLVIAACSTVGPFASRAISTELAVWLEKDRPLILDPAAELGVPTPHSALSQQLYRAAIAQGYGEDDVCGSIRLLEGLAGCEVSS
jgi:3-hydroxyisobutyrate dehydrogenase-like beta-hydroxyacid dehydrogenase